MVMVTGARIASRVKRQFGDESGVQVTNDDILMWLNDAMTEAAVQNGSINIQRSVVAAVAGSPFGSFPSNANMAAVHSLSYRASATQPYEPLTFVSANSFEELFPNWHNGQETGVPRFFTVDTQGTFKVHPAPIVSSATGFTVLYNAFFDDYTDLEEVMLISARYFQYLLEYCLMKAYEMDENWEAADRKASFIQSTLNSLSSDDANANQTKYPVVSSIPEDM